MMKFSDADEGIARQWHNEEGLGVIIDLPDAAVALGDEGGSVG
jgi:hypothetical protein